MSQTSNDFPDWYLEAMRGAAIMEEMGQVDEAERIRYETGQALATHRGAGLVGEIGSTQLKELGEQVLALIRGGNHERL